MKGKILFLAGLGVGYVLGTRAGRERYEQLKSTASQLWNAPLVQKRVDTVQDFVRDKTPEVVEFVAEGAKKVAAQVSGRTTSRTQGSGSRSTASSSSAAKKSGTTKSSSGGSKSGSSTAKKSSSTRKPASGSSS
ncbi:YtxH domain-containing protein [Homoserinibacter sp. GY 40078]|uniref:YtxH domain-containing protein n=1 Tax=Homoserinibacter sp. GY 40078 TaxID=2603275 RepID=UPI0011C9B766|nr:YtxH domain-containing protein [Homoserinibacter sp. GY 40078]TXK18825.1 YtxH domain-containing protein [Homoserinibacter sp. GY 40078]